MPFIITVAWGCGALQISSQLQSCGFQVVGEEEIFLEYSRSSGWSKNQINMRDYRRKSSLILYIRGIYIKIEIPKMVRQDEAYTA